MSVVFVLALVAAFFVWLVVPGTRRYPREEVEPVDQAELDAAEREVRELDIDQRPEDGFEGDDWGPGTARR